jgi:hypothetical protein
MTALFYVGQKLRASNLQDIIDDHLSVAKSVDTPRISTTTLTADPHLVLPFAANYTYIVNFVIYHNSATAADIQFALSFPSGATTPFGGLRLVTSASVTGDVDPGAYSSATSGTSNITAAGSGLANTTLLFATVIMGSTAGNVSLMWAQNASTASNTTLYTGSSMTAERIR